jgi:hypothetical protein
MFEMETDGDCCTHVSALGKCMRLTKIPEEPDQNLAET